MVSLCHVVGGIVVGVRNLAILGAKPSKISAQVPATEFGLLEVPLLLQLPLQQRVEVVDVALGVGGLPVRLGPRPARMPASKAPLVAKTVGVLGLEVRNPHFAEWRWILYSGTAT